VYVEGKAGDASKCFAHGPGIEPTGVVVDKPTYFEVDASSNFLAILFIFFLENAIKL
jgi:hypothetical protein